MIEVGEDYSKNRKNDYSVEAEDGYVVSVLHTYMRTSYIVNLKFVA